MLTFKTFIIHANIHTFMTIHATLQHLHKTGQPSTHVKYMPIFHGHVQDSENYRLTLKWHEINQSLISHVRKCRFVCHPLLQHLTFFSVWKTSLQIPNWHASPKSEILTLSFPPTLLTRTFRADKSRWIICSVHNYIPIDWNNSQRILLAKVC